MLNDLVVIHDRAGTEDHLPTALNSVRWQTCLRRISLLNQTESNGVLAAPGPGSELYRGGEAYHFLLEVVCGLRSPLIGETAVMGQFREFYAHTQFPQTSWGWFLRRCTSDLLVDAKRIRRRHLEGLGSQTYGGLVRHHLKGFTSVAILGAGQLAGEILPWLIGKTEITLFSRNPQRARAEHGEFPQVRHERFTIESAANFDRRDAAVVIAAPLAASEIQKWMRLQEIEFVILLDLRGEAETDPIQGSSKIIRLSELFATVLSQRQHLATQVEAARAEIRIAAERQAQQAQFRPFGWEDLCA